MCGYMYSLMIISHMTLHKVIEFEFPLSSLKKKKKNLICQNDFNFKFLMTCFVLRFGPKKFIIVLFFFFEKSIKF